MTPVKVSPSDPVPNSRFNLAGGNSTNYHLRVHGVRVSQGLQRRD
jgi:hypothetical protein